MTQHRPGRQFDGRDDERIGAMHEQFVQRAEDRHEQRRQRAEKHLAIVEAPLHHERDVPT